MNTEADKLSEALWRRKLSETERAALRGRPELELEARLTGMLANLPAAPLASNFTARVLQQIEREEARAISARNRKWNWRRLWPRVAFASAVLVCAGVIFQKHELKSEHVLLAKNVAAVAVAQPPPSVDALNNFDAIRRMSQRADGELLALMQ